MPTIRVIDEDQAEGRLKEIYEEARGKRGSVADILKVHSLLPETLKGHLDLYMAIQFGKRGPEGLGRPEREMLAVVVSSANGCAYCVKHHSDALEKYWKDPERVAALAADPARVDLTEGERALCAFAQKLTTDPARVTPGDVEALKAAGYADEAVLQAILTTAYFNFVNRVALATDLDPAEDAAKAYGY